MSLHRRLHNDQLSGLLLLALALFAGWYNRAYPLGSLSEPGPGYVPLIVSVLLGLVGLLIAFYGSRSPALASTSWREAPRAVVILAACGAATLVLEVLGYRITVAALLVFLLGVLERRHPLAVAGVAAGFALLSFYLIAIVLRVPLPTGPGGW